VRTVLRSSKSAFAQGWNGTSSGLESAEISRAYLLSFGDHTPVKSGVPSGNRGVGADRSGLPSAVRGIFATGTFVHCADAEGAATATKGMSMAPTNPMRFDLDAASISSSRTATLNLV
jgi:hypothetical protein